MSLPVPEDITYLKRTTFSGYYLDFQSNFPDLSSLFFSYLLNQFLQQEAQETSVNWEYTSVCIQIIYCDQTIDNFPLKDFRNNWTLRE